jgi:surface antigen
MRRVLLVAAAALLASGNATAFNLSFLGDSVVQRLTRADARMLNAAVQAALAAEHEGAEQHWSNPETGASGSVKFRRAFQRGDAPCRSLQIRTTAQATTAGGIYELCRQADGTWTFGS